MGSPQKGGAFQPIMHQTFSQTPTSNLGQEVLVSPLVSSPDSSQSFLVGQDGDGTIVKGKNEVIFCPTTNWYMGSYIFTHLVL